MVWFCLNTPGPVQPLKQCCKICKSSMIHFLNTTWRHHTPANKRKQEHISMHELASRANVGAWFQCQQSCLATLAPADENSHFTLIIISQVSGCLLRNALPRYGLHLVAPLPERRLCGDSPWMSPWGSGELPLWRLSAAFLSLDIVPQCMGTILTIILRRVCGVWVIIGRQALHHVPDTRGVRCYVPCRWSGPLHRTDQQKLP